MYIVLPYNRLSKKKIQSTQTAFSDYLLLQDCDAKDQHLCHFNLKKSMLTKDNNNLMHHFLKKKRPKCTANVIN